MRLAMLLVLAGALCAATPEEAIQKVLRDQQDAWNRGDVVAFMEGYEKTPSLTFIGASISHGHAEVLANYKKRYPTKDAMGALSFEVLTVQMLGSDYANVVGKFHLKRNAAGGGDANGIFTLLFKKTPAGWRIIQDHTS